MIRKVSALDTAETANNIAAINLFSNLFRNSWCFSAAVVLIKLLDIPQIVLSQVLKKPKSDFSRYLIYLQ